MDYMNAGAGYPNNASYLNMDYTQMIQSYCSDLSYLTDILTKLSGSYNLLANSANSFNNNSFSKKDYIEDAIGRTKDLGRVIDKVISTLEVQILLYISYTNIKNEYISNNFSFNEIIESEISHHIKHLEHQSHEDKKD